MYISVHNYHLWLFLNTSSEIICKTDFVKILERHSHSAGLVNFFLSLYNIGKSDIKVNQTVLVDYDISKS
jgi:hypothetical protein